MPDNEIGTVYILKNAAMQGIYKIGITSNDDINKRLKELYTTGVPLPFECAYSCEVKDYKRVEKILHNAFGDPQIRINPNREFFKIEPERVIPLLEHLKIKDTTEITNKAIDESIDKADREANIEYRKRRPNFNFMEMGINPQEKIVLANNESIEEAIIIDEKFVEYKGVKYTLSKLTKELLKDVNKGAIPLQYWKYKDRYLNEYYNDTYN